MAFHFAANHFGGQHWVSNHFRGGVAIAPAAPDVGLSPNLKALVIRLKSLIRCKISTADLNTELVAFDVELDELVSDISATASRLRNVEQEEWPPIVDVNRILNCKIYETDLDDQLAAIDVTIDAMDSDISGVDSRLRHFENQLRIYRGQKRANS